MNAMVQDKQTIYKLYGDPEAGAAVFSQEPVRTGQRRLETKGSDFLPNTQ